MLEWVAKHEYWTAVGAYWVFSAAVSSMPAPSGSTTAGYLWIFRFLHTLAGNITTVVGSRIPGASTVATLMVAVLLCGSGCASQHYNVHPGALSTGDSAAYDALLVAQGVIDQARIALQAGQLPAPAKDPLNALINAYDVARASWLTYRGALATNLPSDVYLSELTVNLTNLTNAIRDFQQKEAQ